MHGEIIHSWWTVATTGGQLVVGRDGCYKLTLASETMGVALGGDVDTAWEVRAMAERSRPEGKHPQRSNVSAEVKLTHLLPSRRSS